MVLSSEHHMFKRFQFWMTADRLGPDIPTSYWKLFFKSTMVRICKRKFKYFDDTAEIRPGAYITGCSKISIGKRVVIRPLSYIVTDANEYGADIVIEDDVMLGAGVHIYTNNHGFSDPEIPVIDQGHDTPEKVVLKKGCWVGANVTVLAGVTIGANSVVGAGSVVTRDVPDGVVAVGVPARVIKKIGSNG